MANTNAFFKALIITLYAALLHTGLSASNTSFLCLRDTECAVGKYCFSSNIFRISGECGDEDCNGILPNCRSRPGLREECRVTEDDCIPGMYCAFNVPGIKPGTSVCIPKIPVGGKCRPYATRPCVGDPEFQCDRTSKTCARLSGRTGDACRFDRDCRRQEGFYCDSRINKCQPQQKAGTPCSSHSNGVCQGFCSPEREGRRTYQRVCVNAQRPGKICQRSSQCKTSSTCNKVRNELGKCVRDTKHIIKLGAPCNPKNDKCDRLRRLRCKRRGGKNICVQMSRLDVTCTKGSVLSECDVTREGAPLECRRRLSFTKKEPFSVSVCARVAEVVPQGAICSRSEQARCEKGTKCTVAPGIFTVDFDDPIAPLAYCVREIKDGGECGSRFQTACLPGAYCVKGRCQRLDKAPIIEETFADDFIACDERVCAQGLECVLRRRTRRCTLKSITVGAGKECYDTARNLRKCENGTSCTRDLKRDGVKRCLPLGGVGDHCDNEDGCKEGLICAQSDFDTRHFARTCFDPRTALGPGKPCKRSSDCGIVKIGSFEEKRLQCLRSNGGKGRKKCFELSTLFNYCNETDNIVCPRNMVCDRLNICVPKKTRSRKV